MTIPRGPSTSGLDAQGAAYARLLADPCAAKLAHPLYAGGEGGYLMRVESDQIINNAATDVGSFGYWCPGAVATGSLTTGISATFVTSDTASQAVTSTALTAPGKAWLLANAGAARCVAACLQISFPGAELNRSGIVAVGQANYGKFTSNSFSPSELRTMAERVRRMPDGMVEIRLVPNFDSQGYSTPNSSVSDDKGLPALFFSVFGIPVNTGIRVRLVAVYEWIPSQGEGITLPSAMTTSESRNSLNDVLRVMKGYGDWAYGGFTEAAGTMSSLYGAASAGRALIRGTRAAGYALMA